MLSPNAFNKKEENFYHYLLTHHISTSLLLRIAVLGLFNLYISVSHLLIGLFLSLTVSCCLLLEVGDLCQASFSSKIEINMDVLDVSGEFPFF